LAFFGAIWPFARVDLAFFAYGYLATLLHSTFIMTQISREIQRTRAKPAKLNEEGQDFINS